MPLTDKEVRSAQPTEKVYRVYDARGLYLEVHPSGGKWWRLKYRFAGKEKRLSLGVYPEVSLKKARDNREECRRDMASSIDPGENRKAMKSARTDGAANSFEVIAREWLGKFIDPMSESHRKRVYARFVNDVFPRIGGRPIAEITPKELLEVVRRIEKREAPDTAHRTLGSCGQVFCYGVATGRCERDVSRDLRGALAPAVESHFSAVTDPSQVGRIMRAIDGYEGTLTVQCALRLAPLVFVRPGELRNAKWKDIDLDKAEWCLELSKKKGSKQNGLPQDRFLIIPLSRQAIKILKELKSLTGAGDFVFPGARSRQRPLSDNAVNAALRRMDIPKEEMCGHGFRATARTILAQEFHIRPDYIEHQLGHQVIDPNGRAYDRTTFLPERQLMMQEWADYLDKLKAGEEVRFNKRERLTDIRNIMVGDFS